MFNLMEKSIMINLAPVEGLAHVQCQIFNRQDMS